MTPEQRAEKIAQLCILAFPNKPDLSLIAAEIQAAVDAMGARPIPCSNCNKEIVSGYFRSTWCYECCERGECRDYMDGKKIGRAEVYEDAIQWVRARARDCGCSEWIEEKIRAKGGGVKQVTCKPDGTHHACDCVLEQLDAADKLAKACERVDKRCLKYRVLPREQICFDIKTWNGEHDWSCINCACIKALANFEKLRGLK